jgi:hypothetical protein
MVAQGTNPFMGTCGTVSWQVVEIDIRSVATYRQYNELGENLHLVSGRPTATAKARKRKPFPKTVLEFF